MPASQQDSYSENQIIDGVVSRPGLPILDIGAGYGRFGDLLKSRVSHIAGIEIYRPYIDKYNLKDKYNEIIHGDIRNMDDAFLSKFKIFILGDVLEHLQRDQAISLIIRLKQHAEAIYLSLPVCICIQESVDGNEAERHLWHWSDVEVRNELGFKLLSFSLNENRLVVIGCYQWSK